MTFDDAIQGWPAIAGLSAAAGFAGTWAGRAIALRTGFVSRPNPIVKQHTRSVPYLGGLGLVAGLLASAPLWLAAVPSAAHRGATPVVGALLFFILGAVDDARPLSPAPKLLLQTLAALLAVLLMTPAGLTTPLNTALGVAWVVTLVNAANFTDVSDGYAAALSLFAFLGFALLSGAGPAVAMAGACAGFLLLNAPPAKVFMGDAGSHVIGFMLAACSLEWTGRQGLSASIIPSLLVCSPFLFDLLFCTVIRAQRGDSIFRGSPDHVALRLIEAGLSKTQTMLAGAISAMALAGAALLFDRSGQAARLVIVAAVAATMAMAWRRLLRHGIAAADP